MKEAVVVTGVSGAIGGAIARRFLAEGVVVVGVDHVPPGDETGCSVFLNCDLKAIGTDEAQGGEFFELLERHLAGTSLRALVNNAAVQHLGSTADLAWTDWLATFQVNLFAPFALTRALLPRLRRARGTVLNITSVHAFATKPNFAAYATSKAALDGLTRALAVDLGPEVRVISLAPAAIDTSMLRAGFAGREELMQQLERVHPAGRVGQPREVADAAFFLTSGEARFMTGGTVRLDGGILSRLHDPA